MRFFILCAAFLALTSCGNHHKVLNGVKYNCYGVFDKIEEMKPEVEYSVSGANIVGAVVFSETVFVPIWNLGWNVYCPEKLVDKL